MWVRIAREHGARSGQEPTPKVSQARPGRKMLGKMPPLQPDRSLPVFSLAEVPAHCVDLPKAGREQAETVERRQLLNTTSRLMPDLTAIGLEPGMMSKNDVASHRRILRVARKTRKTLMGCRALPTGGTARQDGR